MLSSYDGCIWDCLESSLLLKGRHGYGLWALVVDYQFCTQPKNLGWLEHMAASANESHLSLRSNLDNLGVSEKLYVPESFS